MNEAFKVYIDRLKAGEVHKVDGAFDPEFLELDEKELHFEKPVLIRGEAYAADDHLIVHLSASTFAQIPCSVCNELFYYPLTVSGFYATEPLSEFPSAIADFGQYAREALLTELPRTAECNGGKCNARDAITPYLRSEKRSAQPTYYPFADIDSKK